MAKQLYRSTTDRKIAGVCGGLAEYFDIDPVIIRVIFIILALPGGLPGIIPYIILWLIVPEEPAVHQIK
jgi:phage shock protein C